MAQRFQLKRSSIAGKRPGSEYLEPGELALNTNSRDAGVYFEANDGTVLKSGPTFVGNFQPNSEIGYGHGETWLDTSNGSLKVWNDDEKRWASAISPAQGGSNTVLYVGSDYAEASDSISNDGSARPFATLNRACIEVARRSILQNQRDEPFNNKFTIVLLPGENTVLNEPGSTLADFVASDVVFQSGDDATPQQLRGFNPVSGGLPLPRGTSVVGLDMKKTKVIPSFYPFWNRGGSSESSEIHPRSSIFSWTGNAFISNLTFSDKKNESFVTRIDGEAEDEAVFHTFSSHAFRSLQYSDKGEIIADTVNVSYSDNVTTSYRGLASVQPSQSLFVLPLTTTSFKLLDASGKILLRNRFPAEPAPGSDPTVFFTVVSELKTHHRLSTLEYIKQGDLDEFYEKVGVAFSATDFGVSENTFNVVSTETNIITSIDANFSSTVNEAYESEGYVFNVSVRSNYGLCGVTMNGDRVGGLKQVSASHLTGVLFQRDANVYEIYYNKKWRSLLEAYELATSTPTAKVKGEDAISWMGEKVELENIRFYYRSRSADAGGSIGLAEDFSDTRHYLLKSTNGGYIKANNITTVGCAIGCWSQSGGDIHLSNSASVYGTQALRAEGFRGIGTNGGALPPDRDFLIKGIRRPAAIPYVDIINEKNHSKFFLNTDITSVDATSLSFASKVDISSIRPFTLKPGTAIWVQELSGAQSYKAVIGPGGLSKDGLTLDLESSGNELSGKSVSTLGTPYVRRFIDPRPVTHQNYALWVENTSQYHRPPSPSSVLRLAEKPGQGRTDILIYGRQFDPGANGGWNHVFSVAGTLSKKDGDNPNYTEKSNVAPANDGNYYVSLRLGDSAGPWIQHKGENYSRGSFCSYDEKAFCAETNELLSDSTSLTPNSSETNWKSSKVTEYFDLIDETYLGENFAGTADKNRDKYDSDKTHVYARGLTQSRENYESKRTIDWDTGAVDLGLGDSSGLYMDSAYSDPDFSASKQSMLRFMELMGYEHSVIADLMKPQKWSQRNLSVGDIQYSPENGYAVSRGEWPIEFNQSSIINATSHSWENAGYIDYLNGLPSFQTSVLSRRQRFDAMATEVWGGVVFVSGTNEAGKFVMNSINVVNASGRPTDEQF